jgi:hypothetical protein
VNAGLILLLAAALTLGWPDSKTLSGDRHS